MNIIEVKNLRKIYNESEIEVKAINGVDLTFKQGEFTAIVGPSGSGKTTFLNILGGLDYPTDGEVIIDNVNISDLAKRTSIPKDNRSFFVRFITKIFFITAIKNLFQIKKIVQRSRAERKLTTFRQKNIGFVFQAYNLIPVLTAQENVEFIMQLQGISKKDRDPRVEELFSAVGLADRMKSRPNKLSGGQQQRVAVARALASKPKFVLADEPTANLDSKSTQNLLDIMEELNKKENITFIFSTHDKRVVDKARRVITIDDGKVIKDESAVS